MSSIPARRRRRSALGTMLAVTSLAVTSIPAFAQTVYSFTTTITTLGAQGQGAGGMFYAQPATNPQGCLNGLIYVQIGALGSAQYATALAAFYAGRSVRIDYTQDSTNMCWAIIIGGY